MFFWAKEYNFKIQGLTPLFYCHAQKNISMSKKMKRKIEPIDTLLTESTRDNMRVVQISVLFEVFLCRLLGKHYLQIHGRIREGKWKYIIKRIVYVLEKSITRNFNSDGFHESRLCLYIDKLKNILQSKKVIDVDVIHCLSAIIFELLGGTPNYSDRMVMNRHDDYILCKLRTLQYHQSLRQKVWTILEASKFEPFCKYHKHDDLLDFYYTKYNGNPKGFIDWYKNNYPTAYLEIF